MRSHKVLDGRDRSWSKRPNNKLRRAGLLSSAVLFILALAPTCAIATCGTGNPISYDDINTVALGQNGCRNTILESVPKKYRATTFDCSSYWALIWDLDPVPFQGTYSQFTLQDSIGTFQLRITLASVRDILRRNHFFSLSPPSVLVADTAVSVLTVRRCAVITRILMYNSPFDQEPATLKVFQGLRNLINEAEKKRTSAQPTPFNELQFDYLDFR